MTATGIGPVTSTHEFTARYPSRCARKCAVGAILPGDRVRATTTSHGFAGGALNRKRYEHVDCAAAAIDREVVAEIEASDAYAGHLEAVAIGAAREAAEVEAVGAAVAADPAWALDEAKAAVAEATANMRYRTLDYFTEALGYDAALAKAKKVLALTEAAIAALPPRTAWERALAKAKADA